MANWIKSATADANGQFLAQSRKASPATRLYPAKPDGGGKAAEARPSLTSMKK